jgi:hypothetical protein
VFFRELASQLAGERVSADDAPLRPFVRRVPGDAIGAAIPGGRYVEDPAIVEGTAEAAVSEFERDRTFLQARITQPLAIATLERAAPAFGRAREALRERSSDRYSEWDGALTEAVLEQLSSLVGDGRTYSPSSLEGYATCPQKFLMGDLLRIRSVEEPERTFRIDGLRRGSLFHRILERFHGEWKGSGSASLAKDADMDEIDR